MLSKIFIERPRFAVVVSLVITIAGLMALSRIPVAQFPDIVPPQVNIAASYPGASAETVESTVAQPIEDSINGVDNMLYMSSQSSNNGSYELSVTFAIGTDPDLNMVNVQNRLKKAEPLLPQEVTRQGISVDKSTSSFLKAFIFYSPNGSMDPLEVSDWVSANVVDPLARVPGVGSINFFGETYSMRVWLDPERMASLNLTPADLVSALDSQNIQAAVGEIGGPPTSPDQELHFNISARGRLSTVEEFEDVILRVDEEGGLLRLGDVSRVELSTQSYSPLGLYHGQRATGVMLSQQTGSNAVEAANQVDAVLENVRDRFPPDLDFIQVFDATSFVRASIGEVFKAIGIAMVLVIFVVYIFLGSWRTTLIPMCAVPVSLIGTFAVISALGFTANTVSLLALVLAVGIVVDDAIVVVENIERVMREEGLPPREASIKAMRQITGAIVAISLVLLSVFVPVAFIPGLSGKLYQQFAVTISVAMLISAFNALTLSPSLCAVFMKPGEGSRNFLVEKFQGLVHRTRDRYHSLVVTLLRKSAFGLVVAGVCLFSAYGLFRMTPSGFLPEEDNGMFVVQMGLPEGTSFNKTQDVLAKALDLLQTVPGVENIMAVTGINIVNGSMQDNAAFMFIGLKDFEERKEADMQLPVIQMEVTKRLATLPEASAQAFAPPAIIGLDSVGGFSFILEDFQGRDPSDLALEAGKFIRTAMAEPGMMMAFTFFNTDTPMLKAALDRDRAVSLGLQVSDVYQTMQIILGSYYVNDFTHKGKSWQVKLMGDAFSRERVEDVLGFHVRSKDGNMVPLSSVVDLTMATGPQNITRYNNNKSVTVMGSVFPGLGTGVGIAAMENAAKSLPPDMGYEWTGSTYQEKESAGQTIYIFILSFLFAYLFLVALYESWTIPMGVIVSISAAIYGASMAVALTGLSMGLYVQIGIVTLIALASKNAILIVEFAKVAREEGDTIREAAARGSFIRFRAVIMTSLAFLAGLLPLVFATGPGAASRQNVSIAVFGGMIAAVTIGLIIIPLVYAMFQKTREFFHEWRGVPLYGARPPRKDAVELKKTAPDSPDSPNSPSSPGV
ncbi:MAG: efflux RND transporter permease subunit [Deltaproteobacteria bacterium]|jgi:HAE1 family hydrophobic/amphiphilic exporter-1|nr:efflux RND transporter permease subunit [Deltaproteobacteria bacterium]